MGLKDWNSKLAIKLLLEYEFIVINIFILIFSWFKKEFLDHELELINIPMDFSKLENIDLFVWFILSELTITLHSISWQKLIWKVKIKT